jgi:hypothetical protein
MIFFNLYNLPKIIGQKKILKLPNFFLSILENNSQNFSRMPSFFGQHGKIPKFPQAAQSFGLVWKTLLQYELFKVGLN